MNRIDSKPTFRRVFFTLGFAVIGLFVLLVVLGLLIFRTEIRKQILHRDGVLLTSVTHFLNKGDPNGEYYDLDLVDLALDSSGIEGIIAVRVFHPLDKLIQTVPADLFPFQLAAKDRATLQSNQPVIRFFDDYPLEALFADFNLTANAEAPLIEIIVPLESDGQKVSAAIQYWSDGTGVANEFKSLDRYLISTGALVIAGSIAIFLVLFLYARNRLMGLTVLLEQRNRSLVKANAELNMAARTSAIGSVTSHLFHGLKNPLAGLKAYLKLSGQDEEVVALTERMQSLINETLSVIREDNLLNEVMFSMDELLELARKKLSDAQLDLDSRIKISGAGEGSIEARKAQLLVLILRNLVENALDASTEDGCIFLSFKRSEEDLQVEVSDNGPGLPESVKKNLFEPVHSQKSGGTGIGLAISSAIARHIPADLELKHSGSNGTTFLITMSVGKSSDETS